MTDSLHVCHVINSLGFGGAEQLLVDFTAAMGNVEFTVVSLGGDDKLASEIRASGAQVRKLDESLRFDPRTTYQLQNLIAANEFDIIHNHLPYAQTIGRIAAYIAGHNAVISTQHNVPSNYHPIIRTTEQITRSLDDVTVAVSQGVERAHTGAAHEPDKFGDNWCTIYNGIDVRRFRDSVKRADGNSVRKELGIGLEDTIFLNVGRYVSDKSQQDLIEAFSIADISDAVLVLVGHGPLKSDIEKTARKLGVANRVYVTGRVPEVQPYYAAANIFVSASRVEGMPVTLLEAMAAGLPVLASNIPGVNEVVDNGTTGQLFPYNKPQEIASLFTKFHNQDLKSYSKAALQRVRSDFDINAMVNSYIELYEYVANGRDQ